MKRVMWPSPVCGFSRVKEPHWFETEHDGTKTAQEPSVCRSCLKGGLPLGLGSLEMAGLIGNISPNIASQKPWEVWQRGAES